MEKSYLIKGKVSAAAAARKGSALLSILAALGQGETYNNCVLPEKRPKIGGWAIYMDSADAENLCAVNVTVIDENGDPSEKNGRPALDAVAEEITGYTVDSSGTPQYKLALYRADDKGFVYGRLSFESAGSAEEAGETSYADIPDELKDLIRKKTDAGVIPADEAQSIIEVMLFNNVDIPLQMRVVSGWRKYRMTPHRPSTVFQDHERQQALNRNEESLISLGLRSAVSRSPVIFEGAKSVGKNVFAETLAWLLWMPYRIMTLSRQMSPSVWYGERTTDNSAGERLASKEAFELARARVLTDTGEINRIDEAAEFELLKARSASVSIVVESSELYEWMKEGGVLVLNEMNMGDPNLLSSVLNTLTDETGKLYFPGRGDIPVNPDGVLFATQNADYEGTQQQNSATVSRFGCIDFRQPESILGQLIASVSGQLKRDGYGDLEAAGLEPEMPPVPVARRRRSVRRAVDKASFELADRFYQYCMDAVKSGTVTDAVLNIRGFKRALAITAESEGWADLPQWIEIEVINTCPADEREMLKAGLGMIAETLSQEA